jgi:ADP-heptose:LPS heptosyltransferase
MDYDHWTSGEPPLPSTLDTAKYDVVFNLINRVDFIEHSDKTHRSELFARKLGLKEVDFDTDWKLDIPYQWKVDVRKKLLNKAGLLRRKLVVIQIDSKGASRLYPKERLRELIGKLAKVYDVVLTSDTKNQSFSGNVINMTGELSLTEFFGLIADCDLFIGSDSSGNHIAGCVGTKAIGLYGSVDPKYRVSHYETVYPMIGKCKHQPCNDWQKTNCSGWERPLACMWSLLPKDVFAKAQELLMGDNNGNGIL